MRTTLDYNEYGQALPRNKPMQALESPRLRMVGYVSQEEFDEMQTELRTKLEEQTTVLEQTLLELKQIKLHLAILSGEDINSSDVGDEE